MLTSAPMLRYLCIRGVMAVAIAIILFASYLGVQYLAGNFHEVGPGQLYRSGQLTGDQLEYYAKRYGLRSIVNLRGQSDKAAWYRDEVAESNRLGLVHIDFKMSATRELPLEKAKELESILKDVPKPVLIHCQGGADRTGLASAIFLHTVLGQDIERAEGQISLYFGHFAIPYLSQAYPMDETWERLETIYRARENEASL